MRFFFFALIFNFLCFKSSQAQTSFDSTRIAGFFSESLKNGQAYPNLHYLCKRIGSRLSGSPQAAAAVVYCQQLMQQYGFDTVWLQPCMVPHWVRGNTETAMAFVPGGEQRHLRVCALGGSVGTPSDGLSGQIVIVNSMDELEKLGTKGIKGKIVFFNRPMDPEKINTFMAYGGAVDQRWAGPSKAAKFGAIGTICRSMTNEIDGFPHTGSMSYNDSFPKIPCIAIATSDAEWLSKKVLQNPLVTVSFSLSCQTLPDVESFNVIGEIRGSEKPDEIILVGGHLDSWDTGEGAHDDGAGCMQSIEALRLFKALGIKPKRTLRAVMFMNEENGLRGGKKYAEVSLLLKEKHIAAIESDRGGFTPRGFTYGPDSSAIAFILPYLHLLKPYGITDWEKGGGGADIGPLQSQDCRQFGYVPDSQRYFDFHHTPNDTFEGVNRRELQLGAGALASLIYLLSEYGVK